MVKVKYILKNFEKIFENFLKKFSKKIQKYKNNDTYNVVIDWQAYNWQFVQ